MNKERIKKIKDELFSISLKYFNVYKFSGIYQYEWDTFMTSYQKYSRLKLK